MRRLGQVATARASFYIYNTRAEVDAFARSLEAARAVFAD
jgi:cysteine desulfurase/selenocysteine lyase